MFNTITGSYTSYTSAGIVTDDDFGLAKDELRNWTALVDATYYSITGNEGNVIYFTNSLEDSGDFTVEFCTRRDLAMIEDELASEVKFPNALVANKIATTRSHFEQKIKARFKNLYNTYSELDDPMSLIINLGELKIPFIYYCIAECYSDTTLVSDDMNVYNEEKYRNKYKELVNDSLSLLAIDSAQAGELSNSDLGSSPAKGVLLNR